jgi:uncharacterized repeat protein (TIGR01451 family)
MHRILSLALLFTAPLAVPSLGSRSRTIFEKNEGQAGPEVEFVSRQPGITLWLVRDGVVFGLGEDLVRIHWIKPNPEATVTGLEPLPSRSHYLIGKDPGAWRTDVPHFGRVRYDQVYPGTDVVYYGGPQGLEFDWKLAPGADAAAIRFRVEGVDQPHVDRDGHLLAGPVRLKKPVAYQEVEGRRLAVEAAYRLEGSEVTFRLGRYDRSRPLVIDPVVTASTYFGGQGVDQAVAVGTDAAGNVYMAGTTASTNLRTQGPIQGSFQGGDADAFVAKFDSQLRTLIYATYLGGNDRDLGNGLAVDAAGNAYVSGSTRSANFPTTAGAFSRTFGGGTVDGFVAKLNPSGSGFVYSTFVGGTSPEALNRIALDATGNVYAVGTATAAGYPTTPGALQAAFAGGSDAVVTKLDASGSRLLYSTYLGRSGNDRGVDIAINASGEAYVLLRTESPGFPTTANAYQRQHGGAADALVGKLNAAGSALLYLSYLGGSANEEPFSLAPDPNGNVWVTGGTLSTNLPVTSDAPQRTHAGGSDAFLARLPTQASSTAAAVEDGSPSPPQLFPFLPFVTFEGDANNQQGLVIRVFLNGVLWFSISNTAGECNGQNVTGTLGRVQERDPRDGRKMADACLPQGDVFDLVENPNGDASGVGVGVGASSPTTPGSVQTVYGGALLDAQFWVFRPLAAQLEITKSLDEIREAVTGRVKDLSRGDTPLVGDLAVYTIRVRNVGKVAARDVRFGDGQPDSWELVEVRPSRAPLPTDTSAPALCERAQGPAPVAAFECKVAVLDPGQSVAYEFIWRLGYGGFGMINTGIAIALNAPLVLARIPVPSVRGPSELIVTKRVSGPGPNRVGDRVSFEVVLSKFRGLDVPDLPADVRLTDRSTGMAILTVESAPDIHQGQGCKLEGPTEFSCRFRSVVQVPIVVTAVVTDNDYTNRVEAVAVNAPRVEATLSGRVGLPPPEAVQAQRLDCLPRLLEPFPVWGPSVGSPLGDIDLGCAGGAATAAGPDPRVDVQFYVNGGSLVIPPSGAGPVLVIDDPPPNAQVMERPGANVFPGRVASNNSVLWSRIPFSWQAATSPKVIRITNTRVRPDANAAAIVGQVSITPASADNPVLVNPVSPAILGTVVGTDRPARARLTLPRVVSMDAASGEMEFTYVEPFPAAFLKRIETTGGPEPLGMPALQNQLGFNYFTTSGFTPQGSNPSDPNAPGVATNGTRIVIVINGAPTEVAFTAPGCVDSEAASATGPGGRMQARRVDNFQPVDYSGGALVRSCDPAAVPLTGGNGAVVYEVVGPSGVNGADVRDRYGIRLAANCSPRVTGRMFFQAGLGPLDQGSAQGPVRRYQPRLLGRIVEAADICRR